MDTSTGRFISQDTYVGTISDPTSLHKYLYANSNPVMYTDPSGYCVAALIGLDYEASNVSYCLNMFHMLMTSLKAADSLIP